MPRKNIRIIRILDHIIIIIITIIIVLIGDENSQSSPFVIPLTKEFILIWIISRSTFSKPFSWTLISINIYKRYQTPILYQSFLFFFLFIMVIKACFCEFEISPNSNKREWGTLFAHSLLIRRDNSNFPLTSFQTKAKITHFFTKRAEPFTWEQKVGHPPSRTNSI